MHIPSTGQRPSGRRIFIVNLPHGREIQGFPGIRSLFQGAILRLVCLKGLSVWLTSRQAVAITLRFVPGYEPVESALREMANARGYDIAGGTIVIALDQGMFTWTFVAVARSKQKMAPISALGSEMGKFPGVQSFQVSYARN